MDTEKRNMDTEIEELTFGRFLSAERLRKEIRIEAVAAETNIAMSVLLLLEQENHEKLPDEVYVKGFLRAYSGAIGVDGDEVLRRYAKSRAGFDTALKNEADSLGSMGGFWSRLFVPLLLISAVIVLTVMLMPGTEVKPKDPDGKQPVAAGAVDADKEVKSPPTPSPATVDSQRAAPSGEAAETIPPAGGKKWLKVECVTDSWLKVIKDGGKPTEYNLKSGDRLEIEAEEVFNLLIGNAAGIRLSLNGKPVSVPGRTDQVVNLQLP